jgi:hypothetical protein
VVILECDHEERDIAIELISPPKNTTLRAIANTAFGSCKQLLWTDDGGPILETRAETGWSSRAS